MRKNSVYLLDTERKLDVHETFRKRTGRLLNVLFTFNLRPVSRGYNVFTSLKNVASVLFETFPNIHVYCNNNNILPQILLKVLHTGISVQLDICS